MQKATLQRTCRIIIILALMDSQAIFTSLITDRLQLRELVLADADEIFRLRSDERVNKYLDRPQTITHNEAAEFIKKAINENWLYWAISLKDTPKLIGTICLWNSNPEDASIEIGYELQPGYQGKGIMREALNEIIKYVFEKLAYQTIMAYTHAANKPSIALLERNGFQLLLNPDEEISEIIYSLENPHKKA